MTFPLCHITHNAFHKIDKFLKIFWYIPNTYFNATLILSKQLQLFRFAEWNIHCKLQKQALNSFIAPSTDLLKLSKFLYTPTMSRCIILHFVLSKNNLWALLWGKGISELWEFPFLSKICVGFGTQLIETTKFIPTVINEKWYTDKIISPLMKEQASSS